MPNFVEKSYAEELSDQIILLQAKIRSQKRIIVDLECKNAFLRGKLSKIEDALLEKVNNA